MAEPIQQIIANYQKALNDIDINAARRLTNSYRRVYDEMRTKVEALILEVQGSQTALSAAEIRKLARYQKVMDSIKTELTRYGIIVDDVVYTGQMAAAASGAVAATQMILDMFPSELQNSISATLNRMPAEAVRAMVGALQEQSPLASKTLARYGAEAAQKIGEQLMSGLVQGIGSRKTAAEILSSLDNAIGMPLSKALCIARTETNRAFRAATRESYNRNPHVVKGWIWYADITGDPEPCLACFAMHGTKHEMDEQLEDHPNGRCTMLAITPSLEELGIYGVEEPNKDVPTGEELFADMNEAQQRALLGNDRYERYIAGKLSISELATTRHSDEWGDMIAINNI